MTSLTATNGLPSVPTDQCLVSAAARVYVCPHCKACSAPEIIDGPHPVRITTKHDLDELIRELRAAARKSKHTGGGHGVYRRATTDPGRYAVAIEIILRPRPRKRGDPE